MNCFITILALITTISCGDRGAVDSFQDGLDILEASGVTLTICNEPDREEWADNERIHIVKFCYSRDSGKFVSAIVQDTPGGEERTATQKELQYMQKHSVGSFELDYNKEEK